MSTLNKLMVKIAVEKISYESDILYTYLVPENMKDLIAIGKRVVVPFGKGNSKRKGIVVSCLSTDDCDIRKIKSVDIILDEVPFISEKMMELASWMKNNYFCSLYDAIDVMLPAKLNGKFNVLYGINEEKYLNNREILSDDENQIIEKLRDNGGNLSKNIFVNSVEGRSHIKSIQKLINLGILYESVLPVRKRGQKLLKIVSVKDNVDVSKVSLTSKQKLTYEFIKKFDNISVKEVCYFVGVHFSVVEGLIKKNLLDVDDEIIHKNPNVDDCNIVNRLEYELSNEQKIAYDNLVMSLKENEYNVSLIHGVTGSGKTAVFIKLIDYALKMNKNIIMMVPEISLTVQMVNLFKQRYKHKVSILHSGLSDGERFDEWKKIKNGKSKIVVGTRSAVFAPFEDVGLIILDEEQEYTYKSESSPRFHARDVAKLRCKQSNGMVVLASATPSIESYYLAEKGIYKLCKLNERYGNAKLPNVEIVDMNEEASGGNFSQFSVAMIDAIKQNISCGKQSILFLNRRGYHTFAKCVECGKILNCPNCDVSLTYHSDNNRLMCHYCGYSKDFSKKCMNCGKEAVYYTGVGTQKAVEQLETLIPEANILRVDADTTQRKYSHEKLFDEFKCENYNVMMGTQMVSKGLNFSNVTLVGIIFADRALYSDDFRSYERAFSMMTQVIGRAGRGDFEGRAIIQTFTPENSIIDLAAKQDYVGFYRSEIEMRKLMLYPPFVDLCLIGFTCKNEEKTFYAALKFFNKIKKLAAEKYSKLPLRIFKPTQANISKVGGKYRAKILIKCRNNKMFRNMISEMLIINKKEIKNNSVDVFVDINPDNIL